MEKEPEKIVFGWWVDLENARKKVDENGKRLNSPFTTGDSAQIRNCKTIQEVMLGAPVLYNLHHRLEGTSWQHLEKLALVAGVLGHVRSSDKADALPKALAKSATSEADKLRFQRLIQLQTPDELFLPMIRMVKYLKHSTHVWYLARGLYFWGSENDPRKTWAIDFYTTITK